MGSWRNNGGYGFRGTDSMGIICQVCKTKKTINGFSCNDQRYPLGHKVYTKYYRKLLHPDVRVKALILTCPCCNATEWTGRSQSFMQPERILDKLWKLSEEFTRKAQRISVIPTVYSPAERAYVHANKIPKKEGLTARQKEALRRDDSYQKKLREAMHRQEQEYIANLNKNR